MCVVLTLLSTVAGPSKAATSTIVSLDNLAGAGIDHVSFAPLRDECAARLAQPPAAHDALTLHLAFFDAAGLSAGVESVMKQEAREIFADARPHLRFQGAGPPLLPERPTGAS